MDEYMRQSVRPSAMVADIGLAAVLSACQGTGPSAGGRIATNPVSEERLRSHFRTRTASSPGPNSRADEARSSWRWRDKSVSLTSDELHLTPEAFSEVAGKHGVVDVGELFQAGTASFERIDANDDKQLSYDEFSEFNLHFDS